LPPAWKPEPSNALAGGPSASAAGGSCPAGWETWTLEEAVELKLALGYPLAREEFLARARALDENDDEIVCLLDLPDTPSNPPYLGLVSDNIASVRTKRGRAREEDVALQLSNSSVGDCVRVI